MLEKQHKKMKSKDPNTDLVKIEDEELAEAIRESIVIADQKRSEQERLEMEEKRIIEVSVYVSSSYYRRR